MSLTQTELTDRLRRLARDQEIILTHETRIALAHVCDAGLAPVTLEWLVRETHDVLAGLSGSNHLLRVIRDALSERPEHASQAV